MDERHIALLVLSVVCALLGLLVGWRGGVAEGRARERTERAASNPPQEDTMGVIGADNQKHHLFRTRAEEDAAVARSPLAVASDLMALSQRVGAILPRVEVVPAPQQGSEASLGEIDLALAAMMDLKPLVEYGQPGTYDTVQARRKTALLRAEQALLNLRRELSAKDGAQKGGKTLGVEGPEHD